MAPNPANVSVLCQDPELFHSDLNYAGSGVGGNFLRSVSPISSVSIFLSIVKNILPIQYHSYIWKMSPQWHLSNMNVIEINVTDIFTIE